MQLFKDEGVSDELTDNLAEMMDAFDRAGGVHAIHPVRLNGGKARKEIIDRNVTGKLGGAWPTQEDTERAQRWASAVAHHLVSDGRMIWLDEVPPVSVLEREAGRGIAMFRDGFIKHPFADGYVLAYNDSTWERDHEEDLKQFSLPRLTDGVIVIVKPSVDIAVIADRPSIHVMVLTYTEIQGEKSLEVSGEFQCRITADGVETVYADEGKLEPMQRVGLEHLQHLHSLMLFYSLMILNTEHVPIETVVPSEKMNKARIRRGKEPLPGYTHVHAEDYITALTGRIQATPNKVGQGGTHASPVPHLRRGHRRWLDADHTRSTWVRDCLVNVRKPDLGNRARTFYDASKLH